MFEFADKSKTNDADDEYVPALVLFPFPKHLLFTIHVPEYIGILVLNLSPLPKLGDDANVELENPIGYFELTGTLNAYPSLRPYKKQFDKSIPPANIVFC